LLMMCLSFFLHLQLLLVSTSILARVLPVDSVKREYTQANLFKNDYGHSKATLEFANFAAQETIKDTSWLKIGGALRKNLHFGHRSQKRLDMGHLANQCRLL
jgi:hypothetical protein